jgi:hypothetical protein
MRAKSLLFAMAIMLGQVRVSPAVTISITYDSSVTSQTNALQIEGAISSAVQIIENQYNNPITVNLTFYWGATGPFSGGIDLGESQTQFIGLFTYFQITNALAANATSAADASANASLPASDPIAGNNWWVPRSEAKALGLLDANDSANDGSVGFASDQSYTFDPTNRAVHGKFDLIGVAEHEITEAMGRIYGLNRSPGLYIPYDLFRFTGAGVRNFQLTDVNAALVYFSVDNGVTPLKYYYTNVNMGDIQDWQSSNPPDSFDAFVPSGVQLELSVADATTLDILGYNMPALPTNRITGTHLANGNFQINFTNLANANFSVLSSANVATPGANWTWLGTVNQTSAGQFQFTDTRAATTARFYRVSSP